MPPGFFTSLAVKLSSKIKCHLLFNQTISYNEVTFAYGEVDRIDEFTIFQHTSSVQVTAVRIAPRLPHIPTFERVCHDIKMLIQECSQRGRRRGGRGRSSPTFESMLPDPPRRARPLLNSFSTCSNPSGSSDMWSIEAAFCCEHCPDKDHFVIIPPGATAQSVLRCQHGRISSLTREQQYWLQVPNTPEVCYLHDACIDNYPISYTPFVGAKCAI